MTQPSSKTDWEVLELVEQIEAQEPIEFANHDGWEDEGDYDAVQYRVLES
jgi:hypothetical protein